MMVEARDSRSQSLLPTAWVAVGVNVLVILFLPWLNRSVSATKPEVVSVRPMVLHRERTTTPPPIQKRVEPSSPATPPSPLSLAIEAPSMPEMSPSEIKLNESVPVLKLSLQPVAPSETLWTIESLAPSVISQVKSMGLSKAFYEMGELDQMPQTRYRHPPIYPSVAKRLGIEGVFRIQFLLSPDGSISQIEILDRPAGAGTLFDASIQNAVKKWNVTAGRVDGQAVATRIETTLLFQLSK